jgi:hypothetical protein
LFHASAGVRVAADAPLDFAAGRLAGAEGLATGTGTFDEACAGASLGEGAGPFDFAGAGTFAVGFSEAAFAATGAGLFVARAVAFGGEAAAAALARAGGACGFRASTAFAGAAFFAAARRGFAAAVFFATGFFAGAGLTGEPGLLATFTLEGAAFAAPLGLAGEAGLDGLAGLLTLLATGFAFSCRRATRHSLLGRRERAGPAHPDPRRRLDSRLCRPARPLRSQPPARRL